MILHMFAIRDRATDSFGNPMFLVSRGQAVRSFTDEINRQDRENQLYAHPDDFDLYYLGEYVTDKGSFQAIEPEMILVGKTAAIRE
jgi:hypothetical protein